MKNYHNSDVRENTPLSIVKGINPRIINVSNLKDVLADIKAQDPTTAAKMSKAYKHDPPQYKKLKDSLFGFIAGAFTKRDADSCTEYVPLIVLDIDSIESRFQAQFIFQKVTEIGYTYACFISPSGHGIRILVFADNEQSEHENAYQVVTAYFSEILNIKTDVELRKEQNTRKVEGVHFDTSAKAFPRFWYYSYNDQFLYVNEKSKSVNLLTDLKPIPTEDNTEAATPQNLILTLTDDIIIEVVTEMLKTRSIPSGRNNYVFHFVALAKEHGLSDDAIVEHCLTFEEKDFGVAEIAATVKSGTERTQRKYEPIQVLAYYNKMKGIETKPKKSTPLNKAFTVQANGQIALVDPTPVKLKKIDYHATGIYNAARNDNKFLQVCYYLQKKYKFRFNEVANEIDICNLPIQENWEVANLNSLECELLEYGLTAVEKLIKIYLGNYNYCPIVDPLTLYFEGLEKWDGKDHISGLASFVETIDKPEWFLMLFRKALIRTAACALGLTQNRNCLTLHGGQNAGKSRFIRFLVPPDLKKYYKEGLSNPSTKDGRMEMVQNFVINLDDLDSKSKWELGQLKSLFSIEQLKERPVFGIAPYVYKRRASLFASTNKDDILDDDSGETRWNVVKIKTINHDNGGDKGYSKNVNITQVWAQAYAALMSGEKYELTKEEIQESEEKNKAFQKVSLEQELIMKYFELGDIEDPNDFMTSSEIKSELEKVAGLHYSLNINNVGRSCGKLGICKTSQRNERFKGHPVKGYCIRLRGEYAKQPEKFADNSALSNLPPPIKLDNVPIAAGGEDLPF